jgi:hypothetical protein
LKSNPSTSLLHKLQSEGELSHIVATNKRPSPLVADHSPPATKKIKDNEFNSQEIDDFGDYIPIEDLDALLAITEDRTNSSLNLTSKAVMRKSPQV